MITKHFFKTLIVFLFMIIIGMVGIFLVNFFSHGDCNDGKKNGNEKTIDKGGRCDIVKK